MRPKKAQRTKRDLDDVMREATEAAKAWNAAHATRGVSQDREWKQAR